MAKIAIAAVVVLAFVGSVQITIREKIRIRKAILKSTVDAVMSPVEAKQNLISTLLSTLPTQHEIRTMITLAESYAKSWAPDGRLTTAYLYVAASAYEASTTLQAYIISSKRQEATELYLPSGTFGPICPEKDLLQKRTYYVRFFSDVPQWREATVRAIEGMSVELRKAESVRLQIMTPPSSYGDNPQTLGLLLAFFMTHGSMQWKSSWQFKGGKLLNDEKSVFEDFAT